MRRDRSSVLFTPAPEAGVSGGERALTMTARVTREGKRQAHAYA
ncbi:MAG: hypothetical protein AVDCRST_MAG50-1318 [uncultured Acidimicrobiales bacterium]|uniref:Uncharacterized protein n=1 Tax=uncultured Acidimicrobiales bacterium TaxID=310071 RepID=A0A6J4HW71_9ACTN|nr:MAG: hypothetical protein AVDCRST_MAG50-1318 [uncultured Acidimicrobiales bacterium]